MRSLQSPILRPGEFISRGQSAKIISNGLGMTQYSPPSPIYADVPRSNSFYSYINALRQANVIEGYPCGQPDEHCDPPGQPLFPSS